MREEEKRTSQSSSFKRFFKKRWVFPAIYIASAAIILTAVLWYQTSNNATDKYDYKATDLNGKKYNQPSMEVSRALENFEMPVSKSVETVVDKGFYDFKGKESDQQAALVYYDDTYQPNTGIDLKAKNGETFDVVASLSGKVTKVEEDSLLGNVIEIEHDKGIATQYQSVTDVKVKVGDEIHQGQVLAKAGQSLFNEKAGVHVHFEIRKDGVAVNPQNYFDKPMSALQAEEPVKNVNNPANQGLEDSKLKDNQSGSTPDTTGNIEEDQSKDTKSKDDQSKSKDEKKSDDSKAPSEQSSQDKTNS
ncbi:M23 family metallopeptidase [Neobacillus sp. PS3-34]|uniref:M23 family metallopeptidase n=1 Tax=Neobacillus sp. PS3-34 TaxID=3070678 RepID=UPI0027DFA54D|nr:M23 family metallopeptidase [Neobacillus sp. PS3-34]WML46584.1 M23 family metallopeptidase [Neobacillus sp. PS3-34]